MSARGGAASGAAGPEPCAAGTKIVTANQGLGNLNRLKKHRLSKLGAGTDEKRKKPKGGERMKEGKILQAKEGCEKGLVRSQCIPARSISGCSVVQFLSRMLGDVTQGAVPVHSVFPQPLKSPQAGSIPRAAVLPSRESPVPSARQAGSRHFSSNPPHTWVDSV